MRTKTDTVPGQASILSDPAAIAAGEKFRLGVRALQHEYDNVIYDLTVAKRKTLDVWVRYDGDGIHPQTTVYHSSDDPCGKVHPDQDERLRSSGPYGSYWAGHELVSLDYAIDQGLTYCTACANRVAD